MQPLATQRAIFQIEVLFFIKFFFITVILNRLSNSCQNFYIIQTNVYEKLLYMTLLLNQFHFFKCLFSTTFVIGLNEIFNLYCLDTFHILV